MSLLKNLLPQVSPASTALRSVDGWEVSSAALDTLIAGNQIFLRHRGIGPSDRVAILTPNGPEAALAFLTVASACASAPLNPAYSARELEFYLDDLKPKALLISEGFVTPALDLARSLSIDVLTIHPRTGEIAASAPALFEPAEPAWPMPDDTALLLHTSGTTSRPKLVPLSHRNICASARNIAQTLQLTPADSCLNVMPLFHIHGLIGAVLSSLSAGASVICSPGLNVSHFYTWLEQCQPTWYTAVPTMHQAILGRFAPTPHRLRLIRSSSAALPPPVMAALESAFQVPVLESYGMTEAAHQMASNPLPPATRKPGSVGRPAGPEISIIDGEVCIRGINVTAGYEANPDANATAYTNGWFRTGDQGNFDAEGYLFLTGRIKELINRGGEKIAPREIDEALLEHPGVQQAVAFAVPHPSLGEEIGIAIVPKSGAQLTPTAIIEFAATRLADFKIPRIVRIVDEVPKGPTGKIQRIGLAKALGVESLDAKRGTAATTAPRDADEVLLHTIWADILKVREFGVHDTFESLGGDSLAVAQIASLIEERCGVHLPLVAFLTAPTVAGLAQVIRDERATGNSGATSGLIALRTTGTQAPLYCVAGHDGLLLGFTALANHLDRPVYAFQPPREGLETIPTLASRYIDVLRTRQPDGAYHLMGHCFGGFVAYEMACLLAAQSAEVAELTLLECFNPQWMRRQSALYRAQIRGTHLLRRARFHTGRLLAEPSPLEYVRQRATAVQHDRGEQAAQAEYEACILAGASVNPAEQFVANRVAAKHYEAQPYAGAVLLIAPAHPRAGRYPAPLLGWEGLIIGPVRQVNIADNLQGLLVEPVAAEVAAALSGALTAQPR